MRTAIAPEVKAEILDKVKKAEKVPALGKAYGISEKTIYYWLRMKAVGTVSLLEFNKLRESAIKRDHRIHHLRNGEIKKKEGLV